MSRPLKTNEVPIAPFDLRDTGPLHVDVATKRLGGRQFRLAPGAKVDLRATIDPHPCPECGGAVEWASTSKRTAKGLERYVFARCRKNQAHRWGFRAPGEGAHTDIEVTPQAIAEAGGIGEIIDQKIKKLGEEIRKLEEMRKVARSLGLDN